MPAHKNLNNYLFAEQFKNMHGMTVDQALSGKVAKINSTLVTPEEMDEFDKSFTGKRKHVPFAESHAQRLTEGDVPRFLRGYQGNWDTHLIGNEHQVAATLRDLTKVVRDNSRPNPVALYRGAGRSPSEDIGKQKTRPLSFTDDRYVARSFAALGHINKRQIYKANTNMVRGVPLAEIGGIPRTVGRNKRLESEWFVLPESIPEKWPEK
jgi:hypothetical protein